MAIDWVDVEIKAREMRTASVRIIEITNAVNTGKVAGRDLHADTLRDLKTVDGPVARTEAQNAWDDLSAAMTP